jgi:hypothetical protein
MSEPLSTDYLAGVRQRCEAATKGIWISSVEGRDHPLGGETLIMRDNDGQREDDLYLFGGTIADYDFVANAKQDIPLLLDEIERLQRLLAGNG